MLAPARLDLNNIAPFSGIIFWKMAKLILTFPYLPGGQCHFKEANVAEVNVREVNVVAPQKSPVFDWSVY